jgi:hypothetical protein
LARGQKYVEFDLAVECLSALGLKLAAGKAGGSTAKETLQNHPQGMLRKLPEAIKYVA